MNARDTGGLRVWTPRLPRAGHVGCSNACVTRPEKGHWAPMRLDWVGRASLVISLATALSFGGVTAIAHADETRRREVPDYDSRPDPPPDEVDALLWIPRIITGPLYLFSEYVVRIPLGALVTWVEREGIVRFVEELLTFGPNRNIGVFPTAFYDFGFLPSVGLYAFWNGFLTDGNRLSAHAATWGLDWLSLSARDRLTSGETTWFLRGAYLRRPDFILDTAVFFPGSTMLVRYGAESVDGELGYVVQPPHGRSYIGASGTARWARFRESSVEGDPSLPEYAAQIGEPPPTGFVEGYTVLSLRGRGAIDTRDPTGVPSAGVRIAARGEIARSVQEPLATTWFVATGQILGATDFLGGRRTLSLGLDASAIFTRDPSLLPFDLTVDAGGSGPMQGFRPGQLRGLSAVALTLAYDWPVWLLLNARLYVATGNSFGLELDGFALDRLRLSFGLALRATDPGEHPFELGLSLGTDPFDRGATISAVRFFVGARNDL